MSRLDREEHAISREIWDERGYKLYAKGDREVVRELYKGSRLSSAQIADFARKVVQEEGMIIPRFKPKGMVVSKVYPQVRPDEPVKTGVTRHYHADASEPPEPWPTYPSGQPLRERDVYVKQDKEWGPSVWKHIEKNPEEV
jgi:hypothetical protein